MKKAFLAMGIVVALIAAWAWWPPAPQATPAPEAALTKASAPLSVQSVLRIDPRAASLGAAAPAPLARAETPLTAAYRDRRDYAGLWQQLKSAPQTAESVYVKARLYATCAKRPGITPVPQSEEEFVSGLHEREAYRDERIAAYRRKSELCRGVDAGDFSLPEYERMLSQAAAMGDARAQARLLIGEVQRVSSQPNSPAGTIAPIRSGFVVTPEQFNNVVGLLGSGDPEVIQIARGLVSSSIDQGRVVFGRDGEPIDPRAMFAALGLVACDVGRRCGAEAPEILDACAQLGQCAARNITDFTYYYQVSPSEAQLIEGYRQAVGSALRSGTQPPFRLVARPGPSTATYMFGIGSP